MCTAATVQTQSVFASAGWSSGAAELESPLAQHNVPYSAFPCPARPRLVVVNGWDEPQLACVYGDGSPLQMARFIGTSGSVIYSLKFTYDSEFVTFKGLCAVSYMCAYGGGSDTLVYRSYYGGYLSTALMQQFSRHIRYHSDDGGYYQLEGGVESTLLRKGSAPIRSTAFTVSPNGSWAAVEVNGEGILRVNLRTLDVRRVVAATGEYGYGLDPTYELGISDDGGRVAIAGHRAGLSVYDITPGCGDKYQEGSTRFFDYDIPDCPRGSIDYTSYFPGFYDAHLPEFSTDGMHLTVYVVTSTQQGFAWVAAHGHASLHLAPYYVALGDSYTSGEGETDDMFYLPGTNSASNHCHVSIRSYPYLIGASWRVQTTNRACSGSRIPDVEAVSASLKSGEYGTEAPTHISVSIGGNDLNLIGKLKTCLQPGTCEWAQPEKRLASADEIQRLFPKLMKLVLDIQKYHPGAAISIVGYPSVVNTTTDASCDVLTNALLNRDERVYLEETVRYLNVVLRAVAQTNGMRFLDIEQSLVGRRICDPSPDAMNTVRFGDDIGVGKLKIIGNESFHPTPLGHQLEAAAIITSGEQLWPYQSCYDCMLSAEDIAPSGYWMQPADVPAPPQQRFEEFLSATVLQPGKTVAIHFPAGSFLPLSHVRIELHSLPQVLGDVIVSDDGSLSYNIQVPRDTEGYHAVHVIAESNAHQPLDIYQTVAIGNSEPDAITATQVTATIQPIGLSGSAIESVNQITAPDSLERGIDAIPGVVPPQLVASVKGVATSNDASISYRPARRITPLLVMWCAGGCIGGIAVWYAFRRKRQSNDGVERR